MTPLPIWTAESWALALLLMVLLVLLWYLNREFLLLWGIMEITTQEFFFSTTSSDRLMSFWPRIDTVLRHLPVPFQNGRSKALFLHVKTGLVLKQFWGSGPCSCESFLISKIVNPTTWQGYPQSNRACLILSPDICFIPIFWTLKGITAFHCYRQEKPGITGNQLIWSLKAIW